MTTTNLDPTAFEREVAFLCRRKRALLAGGVGGAGVGKAAQVAAAIAPMWDTHLRASATHGGLPVLYMTTAALVGPTLQQLRSRLSQRFIAAASGGHPVGPWVPDVLVVSHDFAHRLCGLLLAGQPRLVVVDEANALTGVSKFESVRVVCNEATRVVVATASAVETDPDELWRMMQLVRVPALGDWGDFAERYCTITGYFNGLPVIDGWKSLADARDAVHTIGYWYMRTSEQPR